MNTRLIMVGFGRAGEAHARYYSTLPDVDVVGIVDRTTARRATARDLFPAAVVTESLTDLGIGADLAVVATPPASHESDIRWAIGAGIHVLCEKPAVLDATIGAELAQKAAVVPVVLYPSHNYLFAPFTRRFQELLSAGRCGTPQHVEIDIERPSAAIGVTSWLPSWRTEAAIAGGGVLVDHGAHCIYLAEAFMGAPITVVSCTATPREGSNVDHDAALLLRFAGGGTGTVRLSWTGSARRNRYLVSGDCGTLTAASGHVVIRDEQGKQRWVIADPAAGHHAHADWLPELFAAIRRRIAEPCVPGPSPWDSAITVARVLTAAYASSDKGGEWVTV